MNIIQYGDKAEMLLTDTDSLTYKVEAENVYENFCKNKELFDFGNYLKYSKYYNNSNNLVISKVKDETWSVLSKRFCRIKT